MITVSISIPLRISGSITQLSTAGVLVQRIVFEPRGWKPRSLATKMLAATKPDPQAALAHLLGLQMYFPLALT